MNTPDPISHIAHMVFGNVQDLQTSLAGVTDLADIEEALLHARALREGKTKVALLERHLRRLRKPPTGRPSPILSMRHPMSGDPCTFEEWKKAEIERIMDNDAYDKEHGREDK